MTYEQCGAANHRETVSTEFRKAQSAFDRSDFAAAAKLATKALTREPDHIGCWEISARALWRLGEFEQALYALEQLIILHPYEPGYFYLKGMILQGLGQCGLAIEAMQRCLEVENSQVAQQAAQAIQELEAWQSALIAEALSADAAFRAHYRRDPIAACSARGFRIAANEHSRSRLRKQIAERSLLWTRPE